MQNPYFPAVLVALFIALITLTMGYGAYINYDLTHALATLKSKELLYQTEIAQKKHDIQMLQASTTELLSELEQTQSALLATKAENADLSLRLGIVVDDNASLQGNINSINEKIGIIDKLTKIDKQLLQKYSRIYFLNENYIPSSLATVTPELVFDKRKTLFLHAEVYPHLAALMTEASSSGAQLSLISAYRSFREQSTLKSVYTVMFGSGANKFSADQGYSEHQLGTTVDFTTPLLGNAYAKFDTTTAYQWLTQNAFKYGFVLSYPKNNLYYVYEPWHWRYVGVVLAVKLHQEGKYFYDLDQRVIDSTLIDFF
jgi:D-alanyl-D-alanine carboxypeptidase